MQLNKFAHAQCALYFLNRAQLKKNVESLEFSVGRSTRNRKFSTDGLRMADMDRSTPRSYILLRDKSEYFSRGTLLKLNKSGSYERHSHARFTFPPGHIRCDNNGDIAPLSEVECDLLYGIFPDADRYEVYSTPGKLEWGRSLKVGVTVLAQLPGFFSDGGQQHQYTTAIIRWCGKINYLEGDIYKFGVEIVVSSCIEIV